MPANRSNLDTLAYDGICRKIKTILYEEIGVYAAGYETGRGIDGAPYVRIDAERGLGLVLSTGMYLPLPARLQRTAFRCLTAHDRAILARFGVTVPTGPARDRSSKKVLETA